MIALVAAIGCVLVAPAVAASRAGSCHGPTDLPSASRTHSEVSGWRV